MPAANIYYKMEGEKTKFKQIDSILLKQGYQALKSIGKGAFGQVLLAQRISDEMMYAVKVMNKFLIKNKPFLKKYITQQINIMTSLNHPNIVRLFYSFETNDFIVLVMQYCKEGNLLSYQAGLSGRSFQLNNAIHVILQLLLGLKYIHQNGFIHRDIKSQNILIKHQFQANRINFIYKIADFGFARPIGKIGARTQCGTQKYMAPQIIANESYGISVDLWALAVLFYFMIFTEYPFQGHDMKSDIIRKCSPIFNVGGVLQKKQKINKITNEAKDFFKQVFKVDCRKRITFSKILSHPLFTPYRNYSQFEDYERVYMELQRNQKLIKDQIRKIPEQQQESQAEPEDETRTVLIKRVKQNYPQNISTYLNVYLEELNFQVKKVLYLKQCAIEMYENYSNYLTYAERLGSKFYLLRAFLFFCEPLLKKLQIKQIPDGFSQINISQQIWLQCTRTQEYQKIVIKLQDQHLKNSFIYEDTYVLTQSIVHQMPIKGFEKGYTLDIIQKDFNEFKFGFRSVTVHLFKVIQNCKNINSHLQNKIKMRIFCCHMIKRIFIRQNIQRNFPFFIQWLKNNRIKYEHSFDFSYFKRWILEESSSNLAENIQILHKIL